MPAATVPIAWDRCRTLIIGCLQNWHPPSAAQLRRHASQKFKNPSPAPKHAGRSTAPRRLQLCLLHGRYIPMMRSLTINVISLMPNCQSFGPLAVKRAPAGDRRP